MREALKLSLLALERNSLTKARRIFGAGKPCDIYLNQKSE